MRLYAFFAILSFLLIYPSIAQAYNCIQDGTCPDSAKENSSEAFLFSSVINDSGELGIEMTGLLMISIGAIIAVIFIYEKCRSEAAA